MKKVALHSLGCKVNSYETDAMRQMLAEGGFEIVSFEEKADIYIVNTCSVTNMADRKSRQLLHRAKKKNPDAVVVAVGCYVQTSQEEAQKDESIDLLIGNNRKIELVGILDDFMAAREHGPDKADEVIDIAAETDYEELEISRTGEHTRAYIKIQDGCNQFCSYCIIPYARGRVRSRDSESIINEVKRLVESGYQEVVLTGIHISSYGIDLPEGVPLIELLERLNAVEGLERIRLGSLEPGIVTEEFTVRLSALDKICPHFHLSLQSGCDRTLQRMNRKYSTSQYYEKVCLLRKYFQNPAITTDVIVGFPGETEEEFEETLNFLEKVEFYEMHIFKYSPRKGTRAAVMPEQISDGKKSERSDRLLQLAGIHSERFRRQWVGKNVEVLLEEKTEIGGSECRTGYTREYIRVVLPGECGLSEKIVKGMIHSVYVEDIMLLMQ